MSGIIAFALTILVALLVLSFALHFLFSPWILVPVAILAWFRFGPRRSRR